MYAVRAFYLVFPCVWQFSSCHGAASIDVRLADGPGKCAGRVEIKHEGQWKRVRKNNWKETNSDAVCRQLKCGNKGKSNSSEKFSKGSGDFLAHKVDCSGNAANINECFENKQQNQETQRAEDEPVGIICEGECFFSYSVLPFDLLLWYVTLWHMWHSPVLYSDSRGVQWNVLIH